MGWGGSLHVDGKVFLQASELHFELAHLHEARPQARIEARLSGTQDRDWPVHRLSSLFQGAMAQECRCQSETVPEKGSTTGVLSL